MTYQQTLDYLYAQLPMYQRTGQAAYKKDLGNILALCSAMNSPQHSFPSVHIAGTNGKGSVCHIMASVFQEQGFRVGIYTSPHYLDFRERIKINGEFISEREVVDFVEHYQGLFEQIKPSFFEMTVAMAFDHFRAHEVDIAIIETGLGGRLDSTNVIQPLLSVITNIGFDHQQMLGNTLELIAGEKAGIIKQETPVVIGQRHPETAHVFENKALELNAPLLFADEAGEIQLQSDGSCTHNLADVALPERFYSDLRAQYQIDNLRTALVALSVMPFPYSLDDESTALGLRQVSRNTYFIGRWQILNEKPLAIGDSAHNVDGIQAVLAEVEKVNYKQLHVVYGTVNDKDLSQIIPLLPARAHYHIAKPNIPRGLDVELLSAQMQDLVHTKYGSVEAAYDNACAFATEEDLVLVLGSIFVMAEVLAVNS